MCIGSATCTNMRWHACTARLCCGAAYEAHSVGRSLHCALKLRCTCTCACTMRLIASLQSTLTIAIRSMSVRRSQMLLKALPKYMLIAYATTCTGLYTRAADRTSYTRTAAHIALSVHSAVAMQHYRRTNVHDDLTYTCLLKYLRCVTAA
jgi:hypothetical protein